MTADSWDETFDVIVVGSGAAGLAAASVSAHGGSNTVVLEKAAQIGGTTAKSSGGSWILNNHHMQANGLTDPKQQALEYMARLSRPATFDAASPTLGMSAWEYDMIETFFDQGSLAIAELESIGAYKTWPMLEFPDYYAHLDENAAPVGRLIFPASGAGDPTGGSGMVQEIASAVERFGGSIRLDNRVVDVVRQNNAVVGVVVQQADCTARLHARKGVVCASGGFMRDPELRLDYLDAPYIPGCGAVSNTGDFIRIARRLGTQLTSMGRPWTAPIVAERVGRETSTVASTFNIPGDGFFAVNTAGHRVVNEKAPYCEFTRTFFVSDSHTSRFPNFPLILIWDEEQASTYGGEHLGNPFPPSDTDPYWVVRGSNIAELVCGIDKRLSELGPLAAMPA